MRTRTAAGSETGISIRNQRGVTKGGQQHPRVAGGEKAQKREERQAAKAGDA